MKKCRFGRVAASIWLIPSANMRHTQGAASLRFLSPQHGREMRRRDRLVEDRREIDAIIRGSEVCRLALAKDNEPYLVPLSFGYDGESIYLHTAGTGKKIEFFEASARVCFELERNVRLVRDDGDACEWSFVFESVIGYGKISELVDLDGKSFALSQITHHYGGTQSNFEGFDLNRVRTWRIAIESVQGKRTDEKEFG